LAIKENTQQLTRNYRSEAWPCGFPAVENVVFSSWLPANDSSHDDFARRDLERAPVFALSVSLHHALLFEKLNCGGEASETIDNPFGTRLSPMS
jgi:hypothetical protein